MSHVGLHGFQFLIGRISNAISMLCWLRDKSVAFSNTGRLARVASPILASVFYNPSVKFESFTPQNSPFLPVAVTLNSIAIYSVNFLS
jgi:hypothetical protein